MNTITHELTIHKIQQDFPGVRVYANFYEGGTPSKNATNTLMSFLVSQFDQPKVGDRLKMTIEKI